MINMFEKFGWDYYTFISQPTYVLDSIDQYFRALADSKNNG